MSNAVQIKLITIADISSVAQVVKIPLISRAILGALARGGITLVQHLCLSAVHQYAEEEYNRCLITLPVAWDGSF